MILWISTFWLLLRVLLCSNMKTRYKWAIRFRMVWNRTSYDRYWRTWFRCKNSWKRRSVWLEEVIRKMMSCRNSVSRLFVYIRWNRRSIPLFRVRLNWCPVSIFKFMRSIRSFWLRFMKMILICSSMSIESILRSRKCWMKYRVVTGK